MLAGGIGILSPSSAGSVIFTIFLITFNVLLFYLMSFSFYSLILGVKFIINVFKDGWVFICSMKWSDSLYKLLAYRKVKAGHLLHN